MKVKEVLNKYLHSQLKDRNSIINPPYPGEILVCSGLKDRGPLVLLTEEDSLKVMRDARFFFDRVVLLTYETLMGSSSALYSGDFDLLVLEEKSLELEIPEQESIEIEVGGNLPRDEFVYYLENAGLIHKSRVYEKGEYVLRGGILDVWTSNIDKPLRIELEGDRVASLRLFDASTQLSTEKIESETILLSTEKFHPAYQIIDNFYCTGPRLDNFNPDFEFTCTGDSLNFVPAQSFHRDLHLFRRELDRLKDYDIYIVVDTGGEIERLRGLFDEEYPNLEYLEDFLSKGFVVDELKLAVFTEADIFGLLRVKQEETVKKIRADEARVFTEGDLVVHEDFGIGRFQGLERITIDRRDMDCLSIEYEDDSRVLIPVEKSYLVTQYIGGGEKEPALSSLSRKKWERKKRRVKKEVKEFAESMLKLYAKRTSSEGYSYSPNDSLHRELELSFPFVETRGQMDAIREVYRDMESRNTMDRLLCGEVGFGKTEVALRAAFKAASDSKQVALLAPTTILSKQHYRTFTDRLEKFPVNVELLSRFTSNREKEIYEKLKEGKCDIVVGTHKLLNKSIEFKDLGLLIIDEEQRFGVKQKEQIKKMRVNIDVLSMSATPIPRTMQFSLLGLRDLSLIETPPEGRKEVITRVIKWDEDLIRDAILKEVERGGQVFFVHNRVRSIESIRQKLEKVVPEMSIVIGHGQLRTRTLEKRMNDFVEGEYDILLSTAIIESGLDMPNVNTIIIDRAETFGLADLHQLRGRVGRSIRQGYCYLIIGDKMTSKARKRISAIKTYSELGSGFKISLRDLEIRGAGEILGEKQHGHIASVGYELYLKLLDEAVKELKGEEVKKPADIEVLLLGSFFIPDYYIPQEEERISLYRKISSIETIPEVEKLREEIEDRFGSLPENLERILEWAKIRILAANTGIKKIKERYRDFKCDFGVEVSKGKIRKLVAEIRGLKFSYDKELTVYVPRNSIFEFLRELNRELNE